MSRRLRFALPILLLLTLAYGIATGIGTGAPTGFAAADCFHLDVDGTIRSCEDAAERAWAPTAAVQAANWAWWGAAAFPVALAVLAAAAWLHLRRRFTLRRTTHPNG